MAHSEAMSAIDSMFMTHDEDGNVTSPTTLYTSILVVLCFILMFFVIIQLVFSLHHHRNKLLSWSTCFYLLCLMWTIVRITYWLILETQDSLTYLELYLLYWLPTPIQFSNFSLLVLFYIQVITGQHWRLKWRMICLPLYFMMTMSMATFTIVWAFNSSNEIKNAYEYGDIYDQEFYKVSSVKVQLIYSSLSFFILSILFAFYGYKISMIESWKRRRMLMSQPKTLAAINFTLWLVFFTRAIRDLATSQSWFVSIWNQLDMNGRVTTFSYFVFFLFWEFLPTVLLLLLITTKAGFGGTSRTKSSLVKKQLPDFGIFHAIQKQSSYGTTNTTTTTTTSPITVVARERWTHGGDLFQDPLRYDSDENQNNSSSGLVSSYLNSLNSNSPRLIVE